MLLRITKRFSKLFLLSYSIKLPASLQSEYFLGGVAASNTAQKLTVNNKECFMNVSVSLGPIVSLMAGILILMIPRLLNSIVAVYLIVIGLIGLLGAGSLRI
ncbi:hypothetical protein RCH06_000067 [Polaromonas sp. CG_9.5]|uniref:DUF3096 domain-containing protein n=1 Tax=Polaromonas sp. CG_9.5 TaxID=3071705 RepID=UPI002E0A7E37|nr:hypothetical protein [Polaromonas sp. CG_9.5]